MTCGFPGLSFLNTSERAMYLLNICLCGLVLKSNVQVGDEFLMDDFIGNASSMRLLRESVQEYDTELPLDIAVLERRLGRNVAASTSMDDPAVITEDVNDKD